MWTRPFVEMMCEDAQSPPPSSCHPLVARPPPMTYPTTQEYETRLQAEGGMLPTNLADLLPIMAGGSGGPPRPRAEDGGGGGGHLSLDINLLSNTSVSQGGASPHQQPPLPPTPSPAAATSSSSERSSSIGRRTSSGLQPGLLSRAVSSKLHQGPSLSLSRAASKIGEPEESDCLSNTAELVSQLHMHHEWDVGSFTRSSMVAADPAE